MNLAIIGISLFISVLYFVMILVFAIAFFLRKEDSPEIKEDTEFVSVIVAFRNEASNLERLTECLLTQNYNSSFEIILVNDHSDDNSSEILSAVSDTRLKVFGLPENITGKKQALRYAVTKSSGKILLFTDADCLVPDNWMSVMVNQLKNQNLHMLCGPVEFEKSKSMFSAMFRLEFMSLTGSGAAGFFINKPFMCNGANYAVTRTVFDEASQHFNDRYSSGDDVFLLHYISKKYKAGFIQNTNALVSTKAPESVKVFFNQRIRWASKTTGYRDLFSVFTAVLTFLMSALLIILAMLSFVDAGYLRFLIIALSAKTIADFIFLIPVTAFYKKTYLLFWLPLLQIFYPLYISTIALLSLFYKPYWKGRKIT